MIETAGGTGDRWLANHALEAHPMEMKPQELWRRADAAAASTVRLREPSPAVFALLAVGLMTLIATVGFIAGLYKALALHNGGTWVHYLFLGLATVTFAWIAFGAANAIAGAAALLIGNGGDSIPAAPPGTPVRSKTALLFPVYHEDPETIARNLRDMAHGLRERSLEKVFVIFILSDTQSDEDREREREVFSQLASDIGDSVTVAYRNRARNVGKKAENIADWLRTHGGGYDFFIVFDADSVMTAATLSCLAATMEAHPDVGLIQTVPRLMDGPTLFSHFQRVANNLFAPLGAAGLASWQGASGNYWGHNAIIRTRAFAESAGLPILPGDAPWGGHIRSHDFVEAALLRRGGWRVTLLTSLEGSYEEGPPTLIEFAVRDRRWMQGNLQHTRILRADGLTPVSRIHLMMGIFNYISSAVWLLVILVGLALMWIEQQRVVSYFDRTKSLFPTWPTYDPAAALTLLGATVIVVLMPKFLGLGLALWPLRRDRGFLPRAARLLIEWTAELLHSVLIAPVSMLNQVRALIELLRRKDSGWMPQQRSGTIIPLSTAFRFHRAHILWGLLIGGVAAYLSWHALAWLTPVVLGLVLSPLITWATSHPNLFSHR